MFVFSWFHVFDDVYRNGFCDGFVYGLAGFGIKCLITFLKRRFRNKRIAREKAEQEHKNKDFLASLSQSENGLFIDARGEFYCPFCSALQKVSRVQFVNKQFHFPDCSHGSDFKPFRKFSSWN